MLRRAAAARMFRTKKDVDKHVQDINSKIKSSSERNMKGYSIAKLYFAVGNGNVKQCLSLIQIMFSIFRWKISRMPDVTLAPTSLRKIPVPWRTS